MLPLIRVVGLGPADADLLTTATARLLANTPEPQGFLRTRVHPAASAAAHFQSFDHVYESARSFDVVYQRIVDDLVRAAQKYGEIVYAVPGSPVVAEHTVELLQELANDFGKSARIRLSVEPALSFVDLSWVRLGVDPVRLGVRLVDGHRFDEQVDGFEQPLLIGQCHSSAVLSDIKLALDDDALDEPPIATVLHHLGLPDEKIALVAWSELDRLSSVHGIDADHLTSVFVPALTSGGTSAVRKLEVQMRALRAGCPWDQEQTHESLSRYVVEEAYELVDAITYLDAEQTPTGEDPIDAFAGELGDVLFQVIFHCCLAAEQGWFTLADVAAVLHEKLERRHPHVFGDVRVADADEVKENWEVIKQAERDSVSDRTENPYARIPKSLPALQWASKVLKIAQANGVVGDEGPGVRQARIRAALERLDVSLGQTRQSAGHTEDSIESPEEVIGSLLLDLVAMARTHGVDAEVALRRAGLTLTEVTRV